MIRLTAVGILLLFCAACDTQDVAEPTSRVRTPDPIPPQVVDPYGFGRGEFPVRASVLLDPLEDLCKRAGGRGLDGAGECPCAAANARFVTGGDSGQCQEVKLLPSRCTLEENGFSSALHRSREEFAECLDGVASLPHANGQFGTRLGFSMEGPEEELEDIAAWADAHAKARDAAFRIWSSIQVENNLVIHVGPPQAPGINHGVLLGLIDPALFGHSWETFRNDVFVPTAADLDLMLGSAPPSAARLQEAFGWDADGAGGQDRGVRRVLGMAYAALVTDQADFEHGYALRGASCLQACRVYSRPFLAEDTGTVVLERIYSQGTVAREALWYFVEGQVQAVVPLSPGRVPAFALVLEYHNNAGQVGGSARLYNFRWRLLAEESHTVANLQALQKLAAAHFARDTGASAIALCEASLKGAFNDPEVGSHVLQGPHLPQAFGEPKLSGSVFGWSPNPAGALDALFSGYSGAAFGFLPLYSDVQAERHGLLVAKAAMEEEPGVRFLPVGGGFGCFDTYNAWWSNVQAHTRVVSGSFGRLLEPIECQQRYGPVLQESAAQTLWVMAVANSGETQRNAPPEDCPGSLAGAPNLVLVAGSSGDVLHPGSVYGERFADIAAPYALQDTGGTSFAAPRVAAVAGRIFHDWPQLTPADTRLVLMASAKRTPGLRSAVRCGGKLDAASARSLAPCVAFWRDQDRQAVLTPAVLLACMQSRGFDPTDAATGMALLKSRGAFQQVYP